MKYIWLVVLIAAAFVAVSKPICGLEQKSAAPAVVTRELFEQRYSAWVDAILQWHKTHPYLSYTSAHKEEQALVGLGVSIIPFLVGKFNGEQWGENNFMRANMLDAMQLITRKSFSEEECREGPSRYPQQNEMQLYVRWWKLGRKAALEGFEATYNEWKRQGSKFGSGYQNTPSVKILRLGLDVLPLLMAKIRAGDSESIGLVRRMVIHPSEERRMSVEELDKWWSAQDCKSIIEWWSKNKQRLTLPQTRNGQS